jgi:AraC-like DNA-binding protein
MRMPTGFSITRKGLERQPGGHVLDRHRHIGAHVCVVIAGGYEEAGDAGRFWMGPGDFLLHTPFEAHLDRFTPRGAQMLNVPLHDWRGLGVFGQVADADAFARAAERDIAEAEAVLRASFTTAAARLADWPDALAADLLANPGLGLGDWARRHALAPATVSRGFRQVFGLSPAAFRAQVRARAAWRALVDGQAPLAAVAADAGFADQAHMTRAVGALTGRTPAQWRKPRSNRFKTPH